MSFFDDPVFFHPENYELCKLVRKSDEIDMKKRVLFEGELTIRPDLGPFTTKYFKILDRKLVYFSVILIFEKTSNKSRIKTKAKLKDIMIF